jgi:hypothetical protein
MLPSEPEDVMPVAVFITILERTITLDVRRTDTIRDLKAMLHQAEGIPPFHQRLKPRFSYGFFNREMNNVDLSDDATLAELNVTYGDFFFFLRRSVSNDAMCFVSTDNSVCARSGPQITRPARKCTNHDCSPSPKLSASSFTRATTFGFTTFVAFALGVFAFAPTVLLFAAEGFFATFAYDTTFTASFRAASAFDAFAGFFNSSDNLNEYFTFTSFSAFVRFRSWTVKCFSSPTGATSSTDAAAASRSTSPATSLAFSAKPVAASSNGASCSFSSIVGKASPLLSPRHHLQTLSRRHNHGQDPNIPSPGTYKSLRDLVQTWLQTQGTLAPKPPKLCKMCFENP